MKIRQIIKEYEVPDVVDATDTYAPPSKGYAIRVHGPLGIAERNATSAATLWYGLTAVFPRDYPPANFQSPEARPHTPQARILDTIDSQGSAVVKSGIASRDLAETLANKLANYGPHPSEPGSSRIPMSQIQVISQDLDEGIVDTVKDKYAQVKDYFDDSPEAVERKLARLRASNAEAQPGANAVAPVQQSAEDPYMILGIQPGADSNAIKLAYRRLAKQHHPDAGGNAAEFQKIKTAFNELLASGAVIREGTAGLPDPNNFDSDNDYYDARDAYAKPQDNGSDYENWAVDDANESKEKVGNMDADAFDAALSRMKKLAGAGPLRTVYDPNKRVYKNVPHAVQPAQQPKKAR